MLVQDTGYTTRRSPGRPCPQGEVRLAHVFMHWNAGRDTAVDITISHAWTSKEESSPCAPSQGRHRNFLVWKESAKHRRCAHEHTRWAFQPAAFGLWCLGRSCPKRASSTASQNMRMDGSRSPQEEVCELMGLALTWGIQDVLQ